VLAPRFVVAANLNALPEESTLAGRLSFTQLIHLEKEAMNKSVVLPFVAALLTATACAPQDVPVEELQQEAAAISARFINTLQPVLQSAIAAGGPVNAIDVCAVEAPRIAQQLSAETGWEVSRVSLKPRNPSTAVADDWERATLQQFDQRQRAGEPGMQINTAEVAGQQFRYMQAQPAMPLCLTCHGTDLSSEVSAALQHHYPGDQATGYAAGEIRGAISLLKNL
jgi:hypothetical protein